MIQLESCELLSEVAIDDFFFKVTLSPTHGGACILWFKDARITNRYKALGRFSFFDKSRVLQFIVRYTVSDDLRKDIDNRKFECRIEGLSPVFFGQFENIPPHRRQIAYRELFDLDHYFDKDDLIRRRKLMAKKFHPDRGGDNYAMTVINQAYEYLSAQAR
jgi:hypothetical protein